MAMMGSLYKFNSQIITAITILVFVGTLSGCGEDAYTGTSTGTTTTTTSGTGTTGGVSTTVSSLALSVSPASIGSGTSDSVTLTAQAKDSGNNVVSGAVVAFSSDGGTLIVTSGTTDANGVATATLSASGDPRNRTITITATSDGTSQTNTVDVTGTSIAINGGSSVVFGDSTTLTLVLTDSSGGALSSQSVIVSTTNSNVLTEIGNTSNSSASSITVTTDSSGQAQVSFTGVATGVVTATSLGTTSTHSVTVSTDTVAFVTGFPTTADLNISTTYEIRVNWAQSGVAVSGGSIAFSATRGTLYDDSIKSNVVTSAITDGSGNASVWVESVNAGPTVIKAQPSGGPEITLEKEFVAPVAGASLMVLQADKSTIGPNGETSTLVAIIRDAQNNLVKNVNVQFSIQADTSGGSITNSVATTDSLGRATSAYVSSGSTTAKDGVTIRAIINETGFTCTTPATDNDCAEIQLTVAQSELFVRMGKSHLMESLDTTRYQKEFNVAVSDSAGNAVANKDMTITVIPNNYYKGYRVWSEDESQWFTITTATCASEDIDLDGILTGSEDQNSNGMLDPGNLVLLSSGSASGTVTTDDTGFALFKIVYAKNYASWVDVKVTATTSVAGTESSDSMDIRVPLLASDATTETAVPGAVSRWGTSAICTDSGITTPINIQSTAGATGSASITVSWTPADNSCASTLYWSTTTIDSAATAAALGAGNIVADISTADNFYVHTGRTSGVTYFYRVAAQFGACAAADPVTNGISSETSAVGPAP